MLIRHSCGYYPERVARDHLIHDYRHRLPLAARTRILAKGYRRYGYSYYKPYCSSCRECVPYRVLVQAFKPNRSMRRILRRNAQLESRWDTPQPSREKFELYVRYQLFRHKNGSGVTQRELATAMLTQMYTNPDDTLELVLHEGKKLVAFAIFDRSADSLSAVYSVYDPAAKKRSLGTLCILLAIGKARELGLPYLNLGLWLKDHPKMSYKQNFQPAEIYCGRHWRPFTG